MDVIDLGSPEFKCEMCGQENVRYVHEMSHPEYQGGLQVGCVCAEKMSEDYTGPADRERKLHNRVARRSRWLNRKWRTSSKGNPYLNVEHVNVVVYPIKRGRYRGQWGYGVDGKTSARSYPTEQAAKLAAFDVMIDRVEAKKQAKANFDDEWL